MLNSDVNVITYNDKLDISNIKNVCSDYDIIVDGLDNYSSRYLVDKECKNSNKPYIYGAIGGYIGQVSVFNYNGGISYIDLYPESEVVTEVRGIYNVLAGITGMFEANEVIKIITGLGEVLSGKLLQYDLRTNMSEIFIV